MCSPTNGQVSITKPLSFPQIEYSGRASTKRHEKRYERDDLRLHIPVRFASAFNLRKMTNIQVENEPGCFELFGPDKGPFLEISSGHPDHGSQGLVPKYDLLGVRGCVGASAELRWIRRRSGQVVSFLIICWGEC